MQNILKTSYGNTLLNLLEQETPNSRVRDLSEVPFL